MKSQSMLKVAGFVSMLAAGHTAVAEEAVVVDVKRMSMEIALSAAQAAVTECRKKGVQVGVTVVDREGHRQVFLRDVLAPELTQRISFKKAYTAVSFTANTSALVRQSKSALANVEDMFFGDGGVIIQAGGQLLGGIGVSGAPSGKTDEECASAGVKAIKEDLELGM